MEESALVWRRASWCGEERPGVDEDAWMPLERGDCASKEREQ